jgi:hypothetical protein
MKVLTLVLIFICMGGIGWGLVHFTLWAIGSTFGYDPTWLQSLGAAVLISLLSPSKRG